jgi:hypothetical protein
VEDCLAKINTDGVDFHGTPPVLPLYLRGG